MVGAALLEATFTHTLLRFFTTDRATTNNEDYTLAIFWVTSLRCKHIDKERRTETQHNLFFTPRLFRPPQAQSSVQSRPRWGGEVRSDRRDWWMGGLVSSKTALICAKVLLTYVLLMLFPCLIIGVIGREKLVNNVVTGHEKLLLHASCLEANRT